MLKKLKEQIKQNRTVYLFLLPSVIIMLLIVGYPLVNTIYYSLTDMTQNTFSMDSEEKQQENRESITRQLINVRGLRMLHGAQRKVYAVLTNGAAFSPAAYNLALTTRSNTIRKAMEIEESLPSGKIIGFGTYYRLNLKKFFDYGTGAGVRRTALISRESNILLGPQGITPRLLAAEQTLRDKQKKHPTRFVGFKNFATILGLQDTPDEIQEKKGVRELVGTLNRTEKALSSLRDDTGIAGIDRELTAGFAGNPLQADVLYKFFYKRPSYFTPARGGRQARLERVRLILRLIRSRDDLKKPAFTLGNNLKDIFLQLTRRIEQVIDRIPERESSLLKEGNRRLEAAFSALFPGNTRGSFLEALSAGVKDEKKKQQMRADFLLFPDNRYRETLAHETERLNRLTALHDRLSGIDNRSSARNKILRFAAVAISNRRSVLAAFEGIKPEKRAIPDGLRLFIRQNKNTISRLRTEAYRKDATLAGYLQLLYSEEAMRNLSRTSTKNLDALLKFEMANARTANSIRGDHSSGFGFWNIFFQTIIWTLVNVFMHFTIGLYLAHWLNKRLKGNTVYRAFLMIPWTVPTFVAAFSWRLIFDFPDGILNKIIVGVGGSAQNFMNDQWILTACIIVNIWVGVPFMMITLLGGLQTIPDEQYEAAEIDGANAFQKLVKVTLPGLKPVASVAVLLGFIWTFNMFNIIYLMTLGIEMKEKNILVTYAYDAFQKQFQYAESATYGVIILSLLLVFGSVYVRMLKKGGEV